MSDPNKDFIYDGDVTVKIAHPSGSVYSHKIRDIEVTSVGHMIPVNVACMLDGAESFLTAYIDYKTNQVFLPKDTSDELGGADDLFIEKVLDHIDTERAEAIRKYDEAFPPRDASGKHPIPAPPQPPQEG